MKKIIAFCVSALLTLFPSFTTTAFASVEEDSDYLTQTTTYIEQLSDGYYGEYTLTESVPAIAAYATSGTKQSSLSYKLFNDDDEVLAVYTLTGTFTYNGSTSSCTHATYTTEVYASAWSFSSASATNSVNTAIGNFTAKKKLLFVTTTTITKTLTITCDKNGVITTNIS